MSWFKNIFSKSKPVINSNYPNYTNTGNANLYGLRSTVTDIEALSNWSFACIDKIAVANSDLLRYAGTNKDAEIELFDNNHWLQQLLNKPNPVNSQVDILRLAVFWLYLNGNVYIHCPKGSQGKPTQLWILPSTAVKIVRGKTQLIEGYQLQSSGANAFLPFSEVIHIKTLKPNPSIDRNILIGSPIYLEAAANAIISDKEQLEYINRHFRRDAIPPLILETNELLSNESWNLFKARWNDTMPNHGLLGVLENGRKITALQSSGSDAANQLVSKQQENDSAKRISSIFGVPYGYLTSDYQNRATSVTQKEIFYNNTIEPLAKLIDNSLTNYFNQFEENVIITHDKYLYSDPEYLLKEREIQFKNGIITINEWRKYDGLEPVINGDVVLLNNSFTTLNNVINPFQQDTNNNINNLIPTNTGELNNDKSIKVFDLSQWDEETKTAYYKAIEDYKKPYEENIYKTTQKVFKRIQGELIKNLKANNKAFAYKNLKWSFDTPIDLFDIDYWTKDLIGLISDDVIELIKTAINDSIKRFNFNELSDFDKTINDLTTESINKITDSINNLHENLKSDIERILKNAGTLNDTQTLLTEIISKTSDKFSKFYTLARARAIATTTATFANSTAQDKIFNENGYTSKWLSQRDDLVRDSHVQADGQKKGIDGYFKVGADRMMFPAGGSLAEENVNCRCSLYPSKL